MPTLEQMTNAIIAVTGLVLALNALFVTIRGPLGRFGRSIAPALPVIGNALAAMFRLQGRYRRMKVVALSMFAMSHAAVATYVAILAAATAALLSLTELPLSKQALLLAAFAIWVALFLHSIVQLLNERRNAHQAWANVRKLESRALRIRQFRGA